jgi:ribosomal protein S18 acetylase RimI-like enzyme
VSVRTTEVEVTYLELRRGELRPGRPPEVAVDIRPVDPPLPSFNRWLYTSVGARFHWVDRLVWTDEQWAAWADRPELETWVAYRAGTPLGYYEFERQGDTVEIACFGLLPGFRGQGLGGHLLTHAAGRGFAMGVERVWLHTCALDSPAALPGYLARGFRITDTRIETRRLAD